MPAHLFWTYLVGIALIAAALSIILTEIFQAWRPLLLGSMLLLFVVYDTHPQHRGVNTALV